MLEFIHLKNVGPAAEMMVDFAPRLNIITGNNGLGKSFLLDVAWWVLTRTWAREKVIPKPGAKAEISYEYTDKKFELYNFTSKYDPVRVKWSRKINRPPIPGIILYAQADGGFSVWDPMRNYCALLLTREEIWKGTEQCKGVLNDWLLWQARKDLRFKFLVAVLKALSLSPKEVLLPGDPQEVTWNSGPTPTLRMPYGEDVPLIHVSAGMRRIIALAYLLTWLWASHTEMARLRGNPSAKEIIFLVDDIEEHLHPKWQRCIVPALLRLTDEFRKFGLRVQIITTTHSPLVLASVEPSFNAKVDGWFDLDLDREAKPPTVTLTKRPYIPYGEIDNWLTSKAFGLKEPRSIEGEQAIDAAKALMRATTLPSHTDVKAIDEALRNAGLPDIDTFWVRWRYFHDQILNTTPE